MRPFSWSMAKSICMTFDCKFLLTELTANNISYQIVMPNKNSKLSSSYVAKQSGSSLVFANCNKASLTSKAWNFIAFILSIQLSQRVCNNGLRVKLETLSCKIFHRFMEEENNVYIRYTTPKKDIALGQELVISHSTSLRLCQPHGV